MDDRFVAHMMSMVESNRHRLILQPHHHESHRHKLPFHAHFHKHNHHSVMSTSRTEVSLSDSDKVPVDFTNSKARVISDPIEIRHCFQDAERQASRTLTRSHSPDSQSRTFVSCWAQPWFHPSLNRQQANELFKQHNYTQGSYLIRASEHLTSCLVLCVAHNHSVLHFPISCMKDQGPEHVNCWTLDGRTKFKDLFQLIDFYQVNTTHIIPTTLDKFITNAVPLQG